MAQVFISLGTNVDRELHVKQGLTALAERYGELTLSSLFESEAVGFAGSAFYNMVIGLQTDESVESVAACLREIEYANGRSPNAKKYSPRTLDLDLLLFDDCIMEQPAQIPRDEICRNAFVLWPLAEIAGDLLHPVIRQSYHDLWQAYDKSSQKLQKIPLNWQP
ncbi:2-amino-4-hydroxy-6-hydroxymethyldihydropteridine diphosphokinase [Thalassomonas viridans]|uniref:2-amino-4-hydroxy-6-hydroxymethyldihydropteridine diphosphokinase n=1 Tax=Thalassomonas viridans TaxID=137584 RepID=A0AAF0CA67_9GAMM|nr:2-amino-4-hydroxy-6-hydroxymethyldihydropteridine diphosphokinase [Thalassomonas viridans]WDE06196.1 2-amino-4-hydroxy-6-hydroxymethyldihydropteridine diphosphokinase [Thalassomonas viridans]